MRVRRYRIDEALILNPGVLRHQITWQQEGPVITQDTFGKDIYTWSDVVTCHADVKALDGLELERAMQKWAEARYRVIQHYYAGLTAKMRINWFIDGQSRLLDVLDISDPPGVGRYQIVTTKDYE